MRRLRLAALLATTVTLALAGACQTGVRQPVGPRRVVVVSYDGVGADLAWRWLDEGVLARPDGLGGLRENGLSARRLEPVNPTLTAVNHVTLATGLPPEATGIVSNRFHRPSDPIGVAVSGYAAPFQGEALWAAARRQGVPVGVLLWPGADARGVERKADFGMAWPGLPLAEGEVLRLEPDDAVFTGEVPSEDGAPPLLWELAVALEGSEPAEMSWRLAAVDSTPDGRPRYDTLAVQGPGEDGWRYVGEREWFALDVTAAAPDDLRPYRYRASCKALQLDRIRGVVRLYRGGVFRLAAYPDAFADALEAAIGPWPGTPDDRLVQAWWLDVGEGIDLDTYLEQVERLDRYLDDALRFTAASEPWRLLLAYHPGADEYQHSSLIVEQRQWAYSPGRALAAREGLDRVGRSVDASVAAAWGLLDPATDVLAVLSDHGQAPLADVVDVNLVLAEAGLVSLVDGRVAPDSPMAGYGDGGCANIYLNLAGREPGGVVPPVDAPALLRRAARALADLTVDGEPPVERIVPRSDLAALGLANPASGDLVVFLEPGYAFADGLAEPVMPSSYYGQHGYLADHPAMDAVFFARGAGVPHRSLTDMRSVEVAPRVARWLGITLGAAPTPDR